jgi:hypothetical protein
MPPGPQNLGNGLKPARAYTVRAFLVFLHLLERQAQRVAELFLTHIQHQSTHPHAAAHVFIGGIR